jgi:glycerophosphoryl diester phosphodiesterase
VDIDMAFHYFALEAGSVHVCGHRGYSLYYPENTLLAFKAAKLWGATSVEIDVVLTAEGEPIILHDLTVDRTTDGRGFAADLSLARIRDLDAGARFDLRFAGIKIPTLAETLEWAKQEDMGIVLEIKEAEHPDLAIERVAGLLAASDTTDRVVVISFDHMVLKRIRKQYSEIRTEAITHARHADVLGVLRACGASSVSIELDMFHPDDGRAIHNAGFSTRVHVPHPDQLAEYWRGGRDRVPKLVAWIADGLIDTISGDDVPFIAKLVKRAGRAG